MSSPISKSQPSNTLDAFPLRGRSQESATDSTRITDLWHQNLEADQTLNSLNANYQDVELESIVDFFLDNYEEERTYGGSDALAAEGLKSRKPPVNEEIVALRKQSDFQKKIGSFLIENPKFRAAYSVIVERLKNDLIGRATLASGYLKPNSYYDLPGRGFAKATAKFQLAFFKTGSTTTVTLASGLVGAACGITSAATSGLSCGGSLALELIPIALGIITPVVTTAIEIGASIAGKISDEVHDAFFNKVEGAVGAQKMRTLAQAGSITHHDQLNMELAFGFVYLWQTQLDLLTEGDVIKFANSWVDIYLKFIQKNKKALSAMLYERDHFNFILDDLTWDDIPKISFVNVLGSTRWNKYWLGASESLQKPLLSCANKNFHSRALVRKTGVRYLKDDHWVYLSDDPQMKESKSLDEYIGRINHHQRTRAWLYGYRTFYSEEQAKKFIGLHSNHYLSYDFPAVRLIPHALTKLPAHVSNPGKRRISIKEGTNYVIQSDFSKHVTETLVLAQPVQRFLPSDGYKKRGSDDILNYFSEDLLPPSATVEEQTHNYLKLLIEQGLLPILSRHQDQLKVEISHLVENKLNPNLKTIHAFISQRLELLEQMQKPELREEVVKRLLEICISKRLNQDSLKEVVADYETANHLLRRSPLKELLENTNKEGRLIVPFTLSNGYDWIIYEMTLTKSGTPFKIHLERKVVQGLNKVKEERLKKLETMIENTLKANESLKGLIFTFNQNPLTVLNRKTVREVYPDIPISSGILVAEYIRCQLTGDQMQREITSIDSLKEISKEHRRLIRYYDRIRYKLPPSVQGHSLKEFFVSEEDIVWRVEENPIGPPVIEKVVKTKLGERIIDAI